MGLTFLVGIDESIIGTAFAQIVMEGRLDPKLKYYVARGPGIHGAKLGLFNRTHLPLKPC
jgi:hypothetical protein